MPEIVEHISLVIGVIGVTVILWGVLLGVLRLVRMEWASLSGRDTLVEREDLRHHLGYYLLLGLRVPDCGGYRPHGADTNTR